MAKKRKARRKQQRKSVVQIWGGNLPPMKRTDFQIGCEFLTAAGRWRCTDVGKRTIAAIRLNHDDDPSWYNGPPYAVIETVFDEYDFEGCEPAPERRTYDATASEIAPVRLRKWRRAKKPIPKGRPKRNSRSKTA
ncbi:MAG: hypothetical protein WA837_15170 [Xanthobacteraceae bacterium]